MPSEITSTLKDQQQDQSKKTEQSLQNIPNRRPMKKKAKKAPVNKSAAAFRTISEVADELGVQQHVLRFWESKFSYVQPLKRGGGRRYYSPKDIDMLQNIQHLLYNEGYTIKGVQKLLQKTRGNLSSVVKGATKAQVEEVSPVEKAVSNKEGELKSMLEELKSMRDLIE